MVSTAVSYSPAGAKRFALALIALTLADLTAIVLSLFAVPGAPFLAEFGYTGLAVLPFTGLCGLAYLGEVRRWAQRLAMVTILVIAASAGAVYIGQGEAALQAIDQAGTGAAIETAALAPDSETAGVLLVALVAVSMGMAALFFTRRAREALSRVTPVSPERFVHTVAVVMTVSLSMAALLPLVVVGAPPATTLAALRPELEPESSLAAELAALAWAIPASILAVGYGMRRSLPQVLLRLGLSRPSVRHVLGSIGMAAGLIIAVTVASYAIHWLWTALGFPRTDSDAVSMLMGEMLSPAGAVVVGITAGLGEELVVRGVLQPRLGIWLSNLLFTSVHASQYHWDALLVIFLLGLFFGLVRERSSTTVSALVHGFYDLGIIVAATQQAG